MRDLKSWSKKLLKEHRVAILLMVLVGVISIAPQIYFVAFSGEFSGIHMFRAGSEDHYVARINEVMNGHPTQGNVFLAKKDLPHLFPPLGEIIVAGAGSLFGLSAANINALSKAFFPPVLFILWYTVVFNAFRSRQVALVSSSFAFLGSNLLDPIGILPGLKSLFSFTGTASKFLLFTRPVNPQVSVSILLIALLLLFFLLYKRVSRYRMWMIIGIGLAWGLSQYVYLYTWSLLTVLIGLHVLYALFKKDWERFKWLSVSGLIYLIIATPYWVNMLAARAHPAYQDAAMRFGIVNGHMPIFSLWLFVGALVLFFFYRKPAYKMGAIFFLVITASIAIAINQQVITGMVLQQGHYHWYFTKPFVASTAVALAIIFVLQKYIKSNSARNAFVGVVVFVLFYNGALVQVSAYQNNLERARELQRFVPVVAFLNDDRTETVWLQNRGVSTELAGYSSDSFINSEYAAYYLIEKEFFVNRLMLEYRLKGVTPSEIADVLDTRREDVSYRIYAMYHREKLGDRALIPQEDLDEIAQSYNDFHERDFEEIFQELGIDLIVWDKKNEPELIYEHISSLERIAELPDDIVIFTVSN